MDPANASLSPPNITGLQGLSEADRQLVAFYYTVAKYLWLVFGFVILISGVVGNTLAFIVLQTSSYRAQSIGFLLSTLAVTDTTSLLTGLLRGLILKVPGGYDIRMGSDWACKPHVFLTYCCQVLGSWTLAIFTMDRTISVLMPLQSKRLFSKRRIIYIWATACCVVVGFYAQLFFIFSLNEYEISGETFKECNFHPEYFDMDYNEIFYWIDMTLFSVIPIVVIVTCNILVCAKLVRMKSKARQLRATSGDDDEKHRSTVALLMVVSLVFVFTTLPYSLHAATYSYISKVTEMDHAVDYIVGTCTKLLFYSNNAVNFLLYCVSAERFRTAMKGVGPKCRNCIKTARNQVKERRSSNPSSRRQSSLTQFTYLEVKPRAVTPIDLKCTKRMEG